MNKNQKGFGVVEGLLILVIVGILGFTGWYVWHSKQATYKTYSNAANSASSTDSTAKQKKTDPYAGWKQYCSDFGRAYVYVSLKAQRLIRRTK
jgi:predicted negative regulator of RcsB-dependent stress response